MLAALRINYETASRINVFLRLIGRMKPGVTAAAANQDVERIAERARETYAITKAADTHYRVEPMHERCGAAVCPADWISSTVPSVRSCVEPPAP